MKMKMKMKKNIEFIFILQDIILVQKRKNSIKYGTI